MNSATKSINARAMEVRISEDTLTVDLEDGRTLSVPILWFPRLRRGTEVEKQNHELMVGGRGIHWPDLDEDISVEGLLMGRKSGESPASLAKWMKIRKT